MQSRLEVAPVFLDRQRQRRDQPRALRQRDPRDQAIGAFASAETTTIGVSALVADIIAAQPSNDGGDLLFESREVLIAQVAMTGDADHQRQAVG